MVHVTDSPNVTVRFVPLEGGFCHVRSPFLAALLEPGVYREVHAEHCVPIATAERRMRDFEGGVKPPKRNKRGAFKTVIS
jgi:hypothetical protein